MENTSASCEKTMSMVATEEMEDPLLVTSAVHLFNDHTEHMFNHTAMCLSHS